MNALRVKVILIQMVFFIKIYKIDFQKVLFATSLDNRCKIDLTTYTKVEF